jgi:hypothetical protein
MNKARVSIHRSGWSIVNSKSPEQTATDSRSASKTPRQDPSQVQTHGHGCSALESIIGKCPKCPHPIIPHSSPHFANQPKAGNKTQTQPAPHTSANCRPADRRHAFKPIAGLDIWAAMAAHTLSKPGQHLRQPSLAAYSKQNQFHTLQNAFRATGCCSEHPVPQ